MERAVMTTAVNTLRNGEEGEGREGERIEEEGERESN